MWDGKFLFALLVAVALSAGVGRIIGWRFRARVLALMSAGGPPREAGHARLPDERGRIRRSGARATSRANHAARRRLILVLVGLSLALGVTEAWWSLRFAYRDGGFGPVKLMTVGLAYSWVMVPVLGQLWRWSWLKTAGASLVYMVVVGALVWLRSADEQKPLAIAGWLLPMIAPLLMVLGLAGSGRLRAIGPYLVPLFLLLALASVVGTDILAGMLETAAGAAWIRAALRLLPPEAVMLIAALLPWLLMAGPAWALGRGIANAYAARWFSDLFYLAGGYWLIALALQALTTSHAVGAFSTTVLAAWLWLPLGVLGLAPWLLPRTVPPTLLVLRVFQRDAEMQHLFARVVDRWRYSGRTSLIAGTDLVVDTLEPDELFAFLGGRLADRYIADEAGLNTRLAELDGPPDRDGRYRVTEFFCYDSTWQRALDVLVARADVVLMDLRGLAANNAGCLYELGVLSRAADLRRVLLLCDRRTDRVAAAAATSEASERFEWMEVDQLDGRAADAILGRLIDGTVG